MAITDYIPNIFGSAAPSSYESLLGMGLLTPEQVQKQQNVANIQGLLGAGLSLAQGMGRTGPRRSAAENIFGALAGGFGAAGGAYQQGLQNVVQQQQLQSAALTQAQAANRLKAIQQAAQQNPQLAQLFAINPEEATKQMLAMERAKMYGFGTEGQPAVTPAAMPTSGAPQVVPQAQMKPGLSVTSKGTQFVGIPNFAAGEKYVDENLNQQARQSLQPQIQPQAAPIIDPASVAKANDLRKKAGLAMSLGDAPTAKFLQDEADRIDPKEQLFYRDDKLVSSKRGVIGDFSGGKILTNEQAIAVGLDPNRGKWTMKGGIPSLVGGTERQTRPLTAEEIVANRLDPNKRYQVKADGVISEIPITEQVVKLTDEQAKAEGLSINAGQKYVRLPSGEYKKVEGTGTTKLLTAQEITSNSLDPNKAYQITPDGNISVVTDIGTVANKADLLKVLPTQFAGIYPTLKPSVDALIARAPTMTRDQIVAESEKILSDDAKIREQLDPKLAAQRLAERKAGKTDVNVFPAGSMPLGKEGANKVDTQLLDLGQSRLRLQSISSNFNPKYLETPFQLRMAAIAELEKVGKKPNPQDAADLAAYSEFTQTAYNELNAYINLITGAAVGSGDEERRLRKGVPDPQKDSPTQFLTKLNTKIKEGRLYEARLGYIKNKGMKITDAGLVDVNQIPTLMRNRKVEIIKDNKLFGNKEYDPKDVNHKAIVRTILAKEFGLAD